METNLATTERRYSEDILVQLFSLCSLSTCYSNSPFSVDELGNPIRPELGDPSYARGNESDEARL